MEAMNIKVFIFNPFQENTYLLSAEDGECVIIDPGCLFNDEKEELTDYIEANGLRVSKILVTHLHLDHAFGIKFLQERFNLSVEAGEKDLPIYERIKRQAEAFGMNPDMVEEGRVDTFLKEGDVVKIGNDSLTVFEVPGHSPGSLMFYSKKSKCVFVGDVLFRGSVGRTDLGGGNSDQLYESLTKKVMVLPDDTKVYSGHGLTTTIAIEKETNPYI